MRAVILAVTLATLLAEPAAGAGVFKCRARDGRLIYQDKACAAGTETLDPPALPRSYVVPAGAGPALPIAPPASPSPPSTTSMRVEDPLPQMYRCTTPEGTSYVDANPGPRGRYVPLWTLGVGSTGGLAGGTIDPRYGAQYTYVEDKCREMPRGELCGWWKQRADETGSERRHAFKDRRAALDQEYAGVRDALARFCR